MIYIEAHDRKWIKTELLQRAKEHSLHLLLFCPILSLLCILPHTIVVCKLNYVCVKFIAMQ